MNYQNYLNYLKENDKQIKKKYWETLKTFFNKHSTDFEDSDWKKLKIIDDIGIIYWGEYEKLSELTISFNNAKTRYWRLSAEENLSMYAFLRYEKDKQLMNLTLLLKEVQLVFKDSNDFVNFIVNEEIKAREKIKSIIDFIKDKK